VALGGQVTVPHIRTANSPPCKVVIVGNSKELGEWDVNKVLHVECAWLCPPRQRLFYQPPAGVGG